MVKYCNLLEVYVQEIIPLHTKLIHILILQVISNHLTYHNNICDLYFPHDSKKQIFRKFCKKI